MNHWKIAAGKNAKLFDEFLENSKVAIHFVDHNFEATEDRNDFQEVVERKSPDASQKKVENQGSQLYRFYREISAGDRVLVYNPDQREYHVGEVTSEAFYQEGKDKPHIREVSWLGTISRDNLSEDTQNSLGSPMTLFKIGGEARSEIENNIKNNMNTNLSDDVKEKIKKYLEQHIEFYYANKDEYKEDEDYKLKAVNTFQENFDLDADDLYEMLEASFADSFNLIQSGRYFPQAVLLEITEEDPEFVREQLRDLFNEDKPVGQRINGFISSFEEEHGRDEDNLFFDSRFLSFILAAKEPAEYSYVKWGDYTDFADLIGYDLEVHLQSSHGEKYKALHSLAEQTRDVLKQSEKFQEMHEDFTDGFDYKDKSYSWTTWDFIFNTVNRLASQSDEAGGRNYFWINRTPQTYSKLKKEGEEDVRTHTDNGNPRRVRDAFENASKGDKAYVYVIKPEGKLKAIVNIVEGIHENESGEEVITINLQEDLTDQISYEDIKDELSFKDLYGKFFLQLTDGDQQIITNIMNDNKELKTEEFSGFTDKSFEMMQKVKEDTSYEAIKEISDDVHEHAVHPLRDLLKDIGRNFDDRDILKLEKEKHLTSHLFKANPRLGAWPFIWGALYPKDSRRVNSMQLFVRMDKGHVGFGVHPSSGKERHARISRNIRENKEALKEYIPQDLFDQYEVCSTDKREDDTEEFESHDVDSLSEFAELLDEKEVHLRKSMESGEAIDKGEELVAYIHNAFEELVPIYVLGTSDDPISVLERYYSDDLSQLKTSETEAVTKESLVDDLFVDEEKIDQMLELLYEDKRQIILQGPPGTGKTYIADKLADYITQDQTRVERIQFHPSYSYEDFVEGYRPTESGDFRLQDGILKEFCAEAEARPEQKFVLIIDEINRGNLSKIFGELMYLLEYRDEEVQLSYSQASFKIPDNVYIIGTMNTADRSLAIMDYALRRRFHFVDQYPELEALEGWLQVNSEVDAGELTDRIEQANNKIAEFMDSKEYAIGHSYFMKEGMDESDLQTILDFEIKPLLQEYFFDDPEKIEEIISLFDE